MLHLILPPIIVVVALILLVYFFSRKFFEVERAVRNGSLHWEAQRGSESGIAAALKGFFLRFLERLAQGSKVASLRAYNSLHRLTQSLREKRQKERTREVVLDRQREVLRPTEEVSPVFAESQTTSSEETFQRSGRLSQNQSFSEQAPVSESGSESSSQSTVKESAALPAALLRRQSARTQSGGRADEKPLRPMVSRRITRPEAPIQAKEEKKSQLEEILIERIAANPRDIEAYERLGDYYLDQSNLQDAKECYRQVLRLSPVHRLAKVKIRKLERMLEQKSNI